MTLSCAKIQHHKNDTNVSQKQVEPGLNIPECEKDVGMGDFAYMLAFAFMHHPYLVCIFFGMPCPHLYIFNVFIFLFPYIFRVTPRAT